MKTKHHLIVALIDAGIDESRATTIADQAFGSEGLLPKEWMRQEIKRVEDEIGERKIYKNALDTALTGDSGMLYRGAEA